MKNNSSKKIDNFTFAILTLLVLFVLLCMITNPAKYISSALDGISAWSFSVLPSVLPFMFFTRLLSVLDFVSVLTKPFSPIVRVLFKAPPISFYTFFMAILSGYPVGSKMIADIYMQGKITKQDAFKMSAFCSTSGPMFIIGAVGVLMFKSAHVGYILFFSHALGAITNGVFFRGFKLKKKENAANIQRPPKENQNKTKIDISEIVTSSTQAILSVGCIITIFFIIIECFSPLFSLMPQPLAFFFQGIIEITKGCINLATLQSSHNIIIATSFVISFGGISTLLQSITMLARVKMPISFFAFQKFLHACFSAAWAFVLLLAFPIF